MRHTPFFAAILALILSGCDESSTPAEIDALVPAAEAGTSDDSGAVDATIDSAVPDAAVPEDASTVDGMVDAFVGIRPARLPNDGPALDGLPESAQPPAAGTVRATKVSTPLRAENPVSTCRPGCFRLENALISVCIEGMSTSSPLTFYGGGLIDAEPIDRPGADAFRQHFVSPTLGQVRPESVRIVADGSGGRATLQIDGRADVGRLAHSYLPVNRLSQSRFITEYTLLPDSDTVFISTWVHADRGADNVKLYEFFDFGPRTDGFKPDTPLNGEAPFTSAFVAATAPDVSYAVLNETGPISVLGLTADVLPIAPVFHGGFALAEDDMVLVERRFIVGTDIESVRPTLEGALPATLRSTPGAVLAIDDGEAVVTQVKVAPDGSADVALVPGLYRVVALDWAGGPSEPVAFEVPTQGPIEVSLPAPASLQLTITDQEGAPIGAQVVLSGRTHKRVFVVGERDVELPAGDWTVQITRGWHFDAFAQAITLEAGQQLSLTAQLTEVIPFEGWSSGEFHQHAEMSLDSAVPVETRVLSNVGAGVGFMVPSDHDNLFDYGPLVEAMGLSDRIAAPITGLEISPLIAHLGAYGIPKDPNASAGGAPPLLIEEPPGEWRLRTLAELMTAAREAGAEFIQINHPHASQAYLDLVEFKPDRDIRTLDSAHWSTDFDTMEIYNERGLFCVTFIDWMAMLNQGMHVTAIGNSDTHFEGGAGFPRNYLPTAGARAQDVTRAEIVSAMREGRSFMAGLAVMDFPQGPQPGDTVSLEEGILRLPIRIRTPPFSRIDRLIVFVNGQPVVDQPIQSALEAILDFEQTVAIPIAAEGTVVVLALGPQGAPFEVGDQPIAVSNPIYVDLDGDGTATPPGVLLPVLPAGLRICQ